MKKIFLTPLKWYQSLSKLTPASCRYYPSCSEYAKWLYLFDNPLFATLKSAKRIASCNQLFPGGIDYPIVAFSPPKNYALKQNNRAFLIQFWLVPTPNGKYFIVKDLYETYSQYSS